MNSIWPLWSEIIVGPKTSSLLQTDNKWLREAKDSYMWSVYPVPIQEKSPLPYPRNLNYPQRERRGKGNGKNNLMFNELETQID